MILSTSPRKAVPLASGDDWEQQPGSISKVASTTRRVFFCGVVVESEQGMPISEGSSNSLSKSACGCNIQSDVQELVASLGEPLCLQSDNNMVQSRPLEMDDNDNAVSPSVYFYSALWMAPVFGVLRRTIQPYVLLMLPRTN
jgi:protein ECT2